MEAWIPALVAAIGSTGLAGLLSHGLQLTRASRYRKAIAALVESAAHFREGSQARIALEEAAKRAALRLAIINNIAVSPFFALTLIASAFAAFVLVAGRAGVFFWDASTPLRLQWGVALWAGMGAIAVFLVITIWHEILRTSTFAYMLESGSTDLRPDGQLTPQVLARSDLRIIARWRYRWRAFWRLGPRRRAAKARRDVRRRTTGSGN